MATINFDVTFDFAAEELQFLDTTDWAGQGITKLNVNGSFNVVTPNGLTYYNHTNTANITGTAAGGSTANITLAGGSSAVDDYYKDLYILLTGGTGSGQSKKIISYNGTTKVAIVESAWSVVPVAASTTYALNLSNIFIAGNLNNQVPIQVPLTAAGLPYNGSYTITYTVYDSNAVDTYTLVKTFELCHTSPTVSITQTVDCISPLFTSTDATVYTVDSIAPTISRTHTVYYPAGSAGIGSPTVGSGATITTNVFYTGNQSTQIASNLTYDLTDGVYVYDEVSGGATVDVDCDNRMCDIFCCVITLYNKMNRYKGKNETLYQEYLSDFTQVMSMVILAREAWNCGKEDAVNAIVTNILDVADCEVGCGCSDGEPVQVTGLGGTVAFTEVTSGAYPIVVTPTTVGSTTTYVLTLDPAFVSSVLASGITVVDSANAYITVAPVTVGTTTTYTLTFVPGALSGIKDELAFKVLIDYPNYLGAFTTIENTEIQPATGSNFLPPTFAPAEPAANTIAFTNALALFNVSAFMTSANDNYKVFTSVEPVSFIQGPETQTNPNLLSRMEGLLLPQINYIQSGQFQIGFFPNNDVGVLLNANFQKIGYKFYLHILIKK